MPGDFSKANRPILPGPYFHFQGTTPAVIQPNLGATVLLAFTNDWGPFKQTTVLNSYQEYVAQFGGTSGTPGDVAVRGAFTGEGVPGYGGAGTVLAYRFGGSAAAKATKQLQNSTPVNALTITAKYEGSRGNALRVAVVDTPGAPSTNDFVLYDGTLEVERYTHTDTDINGLAAAINANSQWITATALVNGAALFVTSTYVVNATPTALTGGNDGSTVTSTEYTNVMAAIEPERFSVLAFSDITPNGDSTDNGILTSLVTWATNLNNAGKRFMTVIGGAANDTASTAVARSVLCASENFINLGMGTYIDDVFGTMSTSKLAPRLAGIVAQRGEAASLTYARLAGLTIATGPTEADKLAMFKGGVIAIGRDSNFESPVRLEKGVTTYTTANNTAKPYLIYRNPKFVKTMQGLQMEFTEWCEANIIGKVPINDKVRDAVRAEISARLQRRVDATVIQPGFTVAVDQNPPPSDNDEFLAFTIGIAFGRSAEQIYFTVTAG
jgi:hypothetical protein